MSKELRRLKDWMDGYEVACVGIMTDFEVMVNDIKIFIDVLIREGEIAEHEAKKFAKACSAGEIPLHQHGLSDADKFLHAAGLINKD